MKTIEQEIEKLMVKASEYTLYHQSYTEAIQEMERWVDKRGFQIDPDESFDTIGTGPPKPSSGNDNRLNLLLYKNGKPAGKVVHFQVYNRGHKTLSPYELNMYISPAPKSEYTKDELE